MFAMLYSFDRKDGKFSNSQSNKEALQPFRHIRQTQYAQANNLVCWTQQSELKRQGK